MSAILIARIRHFTVHRLIGVPCDIWEPTSIIRLKEMKRIFNDLHIPMRQLQPSGHRCRFADAVYTFVRRISLPFDTPSEIPTTRVYSDVVLADIPPLQE